MKIRKDIHNFVFTVGVVETDATISMNNTVYERRQQSNSKKI
jgi:hypothetical protein